MDPLVHTRPEEYQNEKENGKKYYYIGGALIIICILIIGIIFYYCCCIKTKKRADKKSNKRNNPSHINSNLRPINAQQENFKHQFLEMNDDELPAAESIISSQNSPQPLQLPIAEAEIDEKDNCNLRVSPTFTPETTEQNRMSQSRQETITSALVPGTADQVLDQTLTPNIIQQESKKTFRRELLNIEVNVSSDKNSKDGLKNNNEILQPFSYENESYVQERDAEIDVDHTDIRQKIVTIESTMINIESNLNKLKYLTKDLEYDLEPEHISKSTGFENKQKISKHRLDEQPPNKHSLQSTSHLENENKYMWKHTNANVVKTQDSSVNRSNSCIIGPYKKAPKLHKSSRPLSLAVMPSPGHEISSSSSNVLPLSDYDANILEDLRQRLQEHTKDPIASEKDISIPDPDYITGDKEEKIASKVVSEKGSQEVSRNPTIKPREFKGPYGIEDLDEMNNPLTIALRSRNRRKVLEHSDTA